MIKSNRFPQREKSYVLFVLLIILALVLLMAGLPRQAQAQATNLALNKPVTFSSGVQAGNEANRLVDGSTSTRWAANPWPQWVQVDLGATTTITSTELVPYLSRAYQYKVEVSVNGTSYTTVVDKTANTTGGRSSPTASPPPRPATCA